MACRFMSMISNDGMRALPLLEMAIKTSADLALALIMRFSEPCETLASLGNSQTGWRAAGFQNVPARGRRQARSADRR